MHLVWRWPVDAEKQTISFLVVLLFVIVGLIAFGFLSCLGQLN